MHISQLINAISYLAIFLVTLYIFIKWHKDKLKKTARFILSIGSLYFLLAILHILWTFDILNFYIKDFEIIKTGAVVLETILFLCFIHSKTKNKNLKYFLAIFILITTITLISFSNFMLLVAIFSYCLLMILFLDFVYNLPCLKRVGYIGAIYSIVSIILNIIMIFNPIAQKFCLIPTMILFVAFIYLIRDIAYCRFNTDIPIKIQLSKTKLLLISTRYFFFIIGIIGFVIISVIGLHELGHALTAQILGCEHVKAIIFETKALPHAQFICVENSKIPFLILGGIILPLIFGLMIYFNGHRMIKNLSYLVLGFGILAGQKDFLMLGISKNITTSLIISSIIIIAFAIIKIAKDQLDYEFNEITKPSEPQLEDLS